MVEHSISKSDCLTLHNDREKPPLTSPVIESLLGMLHPFIMLKSYLRM